MPINFMLQICKVTRASKLFQRNFYLPLLRPLSPKDALRRHIITGTNILGQKMEHYIPVLEEYKDRVQRRKYMVKGAGKKRQRRKTNMRYVAPFFDENMENHSMLEQYIKSKKKGKGQWYTYFVPDKNVTIVLDHQFERAIRDKDIVDIIIAQRSEKIVVKLKNGKKITMPIAPWDERGALYRGEGWTKKDIEETHHHGRETMGLARLFEAREAGVEEWELEMMRMASKRKTKHKAEHKPEFKEILNVAAENMDWEKFEEEAKEIVQEANDPVEDEPIPMVIDNMEKTKNVNEKLKNAGEEVLAMLPLITDIKEILQFMQDGEFTEIAEVSGVELSLPLSAKDVFVPGQMVNGEEGEIFMPGQTVENVEAETSEFTPGITVLMDGEPNLLPGLVMGDDPSKPMFLPGDSTITESGELQFTETDDDRPRGETPPPPEDEIEEEELPEEQNSEDEAEENRPPSPKTEYIYKPRKKHMKAPRKPVTTLDDATLGAGRNILEIEAVVYDMTIPTFEKDLLEQQKDWVAKLTEKKSREEYNLQKKARAMREKAKNIVKNLPEAPEYVPMEPVRKSEQLAELEADIKKGNFFEVDHKQFLVMERAPRVNWREPYEYSNTYSSVGISRQKVWRSVYRK